MPRIVKKPAERRLEIIEMAQKLFLNKGYESTSLNDVVAALKVAKGTVYHYFSSKEELLDAVVGHMSAQFLEMVREKLKGQEGDALTRLEILSSAINVSDDWRDNLHRLHLSANMGLHVRFLARLVNGLAPMMAETIKQGCEEGIFETAHPLESSEILLAGFQFITDIGVYPWTDEQLKRRSATLSKLAEALLNAPEGSLSFLSR